MSYPGITIITATYNASECLQSCIRSIALQDYPELEYIIIDGGSSDGTLDIIRNNADIISNWISEPDNGIYDAWNKGLKMAKNNWIAFVGADDLLQPRALRKYADLIMKSQCNLDYISSKVQLINSDGSEISVKGEAWSWKSFSRRMTVSHVASLHHKNLFQEIGNFDTKYKCVGDYELLMRKKQSLKTAFLNEVTVKMRIGGTSFSVMALIETVKAKSRTGKRNNIICMLEFCIDYLLFITYFLRHSKAKRH